MSAGYLYVKWHLILIILDYLPVLMNPIGEWYYNQYSLQNHIYNTMYLSDITIIYEQIL